MLFIGLVGTALTAAEIAHLRHPFVAGVVLFTRNYASPAQLSALTAAIRDAAPESLICVDHEGGRVQRFRDGFTLLPEMAAFGRVYDDDPRLAARLAECAGNIMGYELRRHDIDFSLAPVLDLQDGCSSVIGNRAFHHAPDTVITLASALRRGLRHQGMAAVGKHYPGHGRVTGDSHHMLPCDHRPFADRAADRAPFLASIADGIEGIMAAHIMLPEDTRPAGFSRPCLQTLRQHGFAGAILSDDLDMQGALAIAADPIARVQLALDAGADAAMICNNFADIAAVLAANLTPDPAKKARLAALRARPASPDAAAHYQHALAQLAGHHPQLY
ncbi:MAG: beta-N-acetylhexosaminidase [Cardiobacteriaceae bacterium]|nr:beta-N-acetylhexosaminidase [Cardiobacteriaceae bacterium]